MTQEQDSVNAAPLSKRLEMAWPEGLVLTEYMTPEGETVYKVREIAKHLTLHNPQIIARSVPEAYRRKPMLLTNGGPMPTNAVTLPGLLHLVLNGRSEVARQLQRSLYGSLKVTTGEQE